MCAQADPTARLSEHSDYVADLALAAHEQCLLAVSGDGTLSVTDLRAGKVQPPKYPAGHMAF